jgi:hypothetical protein
MHVALPTQKSNVHFPQLWLRRCAWCHVRMRHLHTWCEDCMWAMHENDARPKRPYAPVVWR